MDDNKTVPDGFKDFEKAVKLSKKYDKYDSLPKMKFWFNQMANHYGKVLGTVAADGDQLDIYLGRNAHSPAFVHIIDQLDPSTGKFDEHKVMYGFVSELTAKIAYNKNFDDGWKGLGAITEMTVEDFADWVKGDLTKPVSDEITVSEKAESDTQTDSSNADDKQTETKEAKPELSDNDYQILNGKSITYDVEIGDTGEVVSYTEDAGDAMRYIDDRIEKIEALQVCIG